MLYSKKWLQSYIKEVLPSNDKIINELNSRAFEVEGVSSYEGDTVFDIKVLPNRHGDALSHYYMAIEIAGLLGLKNKQYPKISLSQKVESGVKITDKSACSVFAYVKIDGVKNIDSPAWLRDSLLSIGQKSINAIVDVTNYVQFAINKPLHSYDNANVSGEFIVRFAKEAEELVTLSDAILSLDSSTLVIADSEKVLGLAGIKGGKHSGVNASTTSILLESAHFDPVLIRKTSSKYNLKTDASKRFEAGQSPELVIEALEYAVFLYKQIFQDATFSVIHIGGDIPKWQYKVGVSARELNLAMGSDMSSLDIKNALDALRFKHTTTTPEETIGAIYKDLIGKDYANPTSMRSDAPEKFSCSSLISYLFTMCGVYAPSLVVDKYVFAEQIHEKDIKPFDLVFASTGEGEFRRSSVSFMRGTPVVNDVDHVGIILPNNNILHATKVTGKVVEQSKEEFFKGRKLLSYGRLCDAGEERFVVELPHVRVDVRRPEDLIEEIGRMYGYSNLTPVLPVMKGKGQVAPFISLEYSLKKYLVEKGYTEVMTSTFADRGEMYIEKGLAQDKEALRTNISSGLISAYDKNFSYLPLLIVDRVACFEIGSVFVGGKESRHLSILIDDGKKKSSFAETLDFVVAGMRELLNVEHIEYDKVSSKPYCLEIDLNQFGYESFTPYVSLGYDYGQQKKYVPVSIFPLMTRDVSVFLGENVSSSDLDIICREHIKGICKVGYKVDEFIKTLEDGTKKRSLAYRFVYQSNEKTLTDDEVNTLVKNVYDQFESLGCELR